MASYRRRYDRFDVDDVVSTSMQGKHVASTFLRHAPTGAVVTFSEKKKDFNTDFAKSLVLAPVEEFRIVFYFTV